MTEHVPHRQVDRPPPPPPPTPVALLARLRREDADAFATDTRDALVAIADATERIAGALETLIPGAGGSDA